MSPRALTWGVAAALAAATPFVLPRAGLTTVSLLAIALLLIAIVAALVEGPQALLLAVAALGLAATVAAEAPSATVRERDLGVGLMPLVLPFAAAALLRPRGARLVVVLGGLLAGPVRMAVYEPFLDPSCQGCSRGELVIHAMPSVAAVLHPLGICVAIAGILWGLRSGPWELVGVLAATTAYALDLARDEALVLGCVVAGIGVVRRVLASYRKRSRLDRLVRSLEAGDDVDDLARLQELEALDDPVAALVLENRRLTAELASQVELVTAARASVVRVAAAERRALERDLHDGVQQQLLALGFDLRVALAAQPSDQPSDQSSDRPSDQPDDLTSDQPDDVELKAALHEVMAALEEVREITHGVYPPLLATRGLAAAAAYVARKHHSAAMLTVPEERFDPSVERAAFMVVGDAVRRGATSVRVTWAGGLHVCAEGVGEPGVRLHDVIGALGGTLVADGARVIATIPCA